MTDGSHPHFPLHTLGWDDGWVSPTLPVKEDDREKKITACQGCVFCSATRGYTRPGADRRNARRGGDGTDGAACMLCVLNTSRMGKVQIWEAIFRNNSCEWRRQFKYVGVSAFPYCFCVPYKWFRRWSVLKKWVSVIEENVSSAWWSYWELAGCLLVHTLTEFISVQVRSAWANIVSKRSGSLLHSTRLSKVSPSLPLKQLVHYYVWSTSLVLSR